MLRRLMMAGADEGGGVAYLSVRVLVTATQGGYAAAQELEMYGYVGGPNLCSGGAPFSSGDLSTYLLSYAFDGNRAGAVDACWVSSQGSGISEASPIWIGYTFPEPRVVRLVDWYCRIWSGGAGQTPRDIVIQGSNDLVNWDSLSTHTGNIQSQWSPGAAIRFMAQ